MTMQLLRRSLRTTLDNALADGATHLDAEAEKTSPGAR